MLRIFENQYDKLNLDNYIIENLISTGNSFVYQAKELKTSKKVIIQLYKIHISEKDIFIQTITSLIYLNLPNFVKIYEYGIFSSEKISQIFKNFQMKDEKKTIFIVAEEFVKNGDIDRMMKEYLMSDGKTQNCLLNPTIRSKIIFGVASIMKSLHKNKFLHRNLTLSHILIDENYEPKISFSINSQFLNGNFKKFHLLSGSHFFMAPEILLNNDYSFPADVYSYAIVVYKMFSNSLQFVQGFAVNRFDFIRKILNEERLKRPQNISDDFWELIQKCWLSLIHI